MSNTITQMLAWLNDVRNQCIESNREKRSTLIGFGYQEAITDALAKLEALAAINGDEVE